MRALLKVMAAFLVTFISVCLLCSCSRLKPEMLVLTPAILTPTGPVAETEPLSVVVAIPTVMPSSTEVVPVTSTAMATTESKAKFELTPESVTKITLTFEKGTLFSKEVSSISVVRKAPEVIATVETPDGKKLSSNLVYQEYIHIVDCFNKFFAGLQTLDTNVIGRTAIWHVEIFKTNRSKLDIVNHGVIFINRQRYSLVDLALEDDPINVLANLASRILQENR